MSLPKSQRATTQEVQGSKLWTRINSHAPILVTSMLIAILPTARLHNLGYVDPNLYVGYALNFEWLLNSSGYEYHATRFPYIGFINVILENFESYAGILYKFFLIYILIISSVKICDHMKLTRNQKILATLLITLNPLTQSIVSWTMMNGFAGIFCVFALSYAFSMQKRTIKTFVMGFILVTCFLFNAYGSIFPLIAAGTIILASSKDPSKKLAQISHLAIGILVSGFGYQLFWNLVLGISGLMWQPHFDVIFNSKTSTNNWVPVTKPLQEGFIAFAMIGISLIIFYALKRKLLSETEKLASLSGVVMFLFGVFTYLIKINFSFTSFWYYYSLLPFITLAIVIFAKRIESIENLVIFLILTLIFALSAFWFKYENATFVSTLSVFCLYSIYQLGRKAGSKKNQENILNIVLLTFSMGISSLSFFQGLHPGLNPGDNSKSIELLVDQKFYNDYLKSLPSNFGAVKTWAEKDATGYLGSIISSSAYHLIRVEGSGPQQEKVDFSNLTITNREKISCLVFITTLNWKLSKELDVLTDFSWIETKDLPSNYGKLNLYCKQKSK